MNDQNDTTVGGGLSAKQMHTIPYLVQNPNISEAVEEAGISRATVYEWLKVPAFREELDRQRAISYDETLAKFYSLGDLAIKAYAIALDSFEHRRAAASDFFKHLARAKEGYVNTQRANETARSQDAILKRLEEIEKTLAMRKPEQPESSVVKLKRRTGAKE
jgi:hypothetical protein